MNLSVKGGNCVKGANLGFLIWIMVEEMIYLPSVKGVKGVNNIILTSEDV